MTLITRPVDYFHADTRCEGFFACDENSPGPRPAILVAHTWAGRDDFAIGKARQLAELGYAAFALDMYGDAQIGNSPEQCGQLMGSVIADRSFLQARIKAALDALRQQPEVNPDKIAAIGFCFGGLCVLDLARNGADICGVVSFHGLFTPPDPHPEQRIKAKVLVLHGFEDPMATPEQATALGHELTRYQADWQVHFYGNTAHAFTNPRANDPSLGTIYEPTADRRSWQSLLDFLGEVLE